MISAQVTNNNYASVARYNAHTEVAARASTRPFGAIPGLASLNACGDLRVCNYQNVTAEHFLARQLRPLEDGVMAELINANWPALDTSGTVWKSSSELGWTTWGARNLISTQVRNGRGHHLRARY